MSPQNGVKRKAGTWIKLYAEKWIHGSTREELTNAERAVWIDLLAMAALNDPPGQVDFTSFRRLANQLNISQKLLKGCIKKALLNSKIRLGRFHVDPQSGERIEETSSNFDEFETSVIISVTDQSNYGTVQFSLIILNWSRYQSEYLRQRPYRNEQPKLETEEDKVPKVVTRVTDRGDEKRKEEIRLEEKRGEDCEVTPPKPTIDLPPHPPPSSQPSASLKDRFLLLLKNCLGYPFDQEQDSLLFDYAFEQFPGIDILEETKKKVSWWKTHPKSLLISPRERLKGWFLKEYEFRKQVESRPENRIRHDHRDGTKGPEPSDQERTLIPQWKLEWAAKLDRHMEEHGIENEDDVNFAGFEMETESAFVTRKLKEYRANKNQKKA